MIQEGTTFDHDFYVVVGKQCRTVKLVMKSMKLCYFFFKLHFSTNIFGMLKT